MYVYLYDNFLRHKKFFAAIKAIEVRLTDYGIAGKILRINNYSDARIIVDDEIKRGAKTIVIVGNDETFGHVLSRSATAETVFGFLPIGPNNSIAKVLGIPVGVEACDILSRRRRERLDVGWVNSRYFVSQLHIPPSRIEAVYDQRFKVFGKVLIEMMVCNLKPFFLDAAGVRQQRVHPQDGKLEAFVRPLTRKRWWGYTFEEPSLFPFEEMIITGRDPFVVETDGKRSKEIKLTIKMANQKIDMIVGRSRKF